jgi:hypothetical protein
MRSSFTINTWHDRLHSPVTWHVVAVSVLAVVALALSIRVVAGRSLSPSIRERSMAERRARLASLQAELVPLRGVSNEIAQTGNEIERFYQNRIPTSYSQVSSSIGAIAIRSGVRLTQIEYSQGEPGTDLTEISMVAGVNGEYPQVIRFVNGVERDQVFFVVRTLSFTGQQDGLVSLRVRMSTWLRSPTRRHSTLDESIGVISQLDRR